MSYRRSNNRSEEYSHESPIYSRLFIICDRDTTESEFHEVFSKYGNVEEVRIVRDRNTDKPKGVAYIKFSKTSEAAQALESMHMRPMPNTIRRLRIVVATNKSDIQSDDDDSKYKRLFITVPRSMTEEEINDTFSAYGYVESVLLQRDRSSGESKGFAYVKYTKFLSAAQAYEKCDRKYRAVFAMPKGHNRRQETPYEQNINSLNLSSNINSTLMSAMNTQSKGYTEVNFMCGPMLTMPVVRRLFDLVPGLVDIQYYVDLMQRYGKGTVLYSNPVSAAYAVEKLHNFEYPPGMNIFVKPADPKFDSTDENFPAIPDAVRNLKNVIATTVNTQSPDIAQLAEAIAETSKLLKIATTGVSDHDIPDSSNLNYCSAKLPPQQPLADIDSPVVKRCFLVCKPQPPPLAVLRDIFCRFGDLINVYTLSGKTVGFARYASAKAADEAIKTLHGAEVCGVRIIVVEAEEEDRHAKKARYDRRD